MSAHHLEIQNLSFKLSRKLILSNLNIGIKKGEVIAVLGHNGAGKTTLFHIVLGLKFPTHGSVKINGIHAHETAARKKMAFVPERPYLNPGDTLRDALLFFGKLTGLTRTELTEQKLQSLIELVGLNKAGGADVLDRKLKAFSKGMLQRSLIAQALLNDPEFLIFDEPMSGLDPAGRIWLKELMLELKAKGKTVLFSTHVPEDVEHLADKVLTLNQGKVESFALAQAVARGTGGEV